MKTILRYAAAGLALLLLIVVVALAAKGPISGTESIVINEVRMDASGNCEAKYQVTFSGDPRYNRYGSVNFNTGATKQLVADALAAAVTQEQL